MRCFLLALIMGMSGLAAHAADTGQATGCDRDSLSVRIRAIEGQPRFVPFVVRVVQQDATIFDSPSGGNARRVSLPLSMNVYLNDPGAAGSERVHISRSDEMATPGQQPSGLGWIARSDVLCREDPLSDQTTGLLRRALIMTEADVPGQVKARKVFAAPRDGVCVPEGCPEVTRLTSLYVYLERGEYVLVSTQVSLRHPSARVLGWIPKVHVIPWNTAIGLRPAENVNQRTTRGGKTGRFVCLFEHETDIGNSEKSDTVDGGKVWYELDIRLPLLRSDETKKIYEVVASGLARQGNLEEALAQLMRLNTLDVFFVIDGTSSMKLVFDAIVGRGKPGLVPQINTKLVSKLTQGGNIRLGFQVYRDSVRGSANGVRDAESLPLPPDCTASNAKEFETALGKVIAADRSDDLDYFENSFGGLSAAASSVLASCPQNMKLVIMIGDHGYSGAQQSARNHPALTVSAVASQLKRAEGQGTQPLLLVLQTPEVKDSTTKNVPEYDKAYDDYEKQAREIIGQLFPRYSDADRQKLFRRLGRDLGGGAVVNPVLALLDELLDPSKLASLADRVRGGQSVDGAMEQLIRQGGSDRSVAPILFLEDQIRGAVCQRIDCTKQTVEAVKRAFLPHSDDVIADIFLTQVNFESWVTILEGIRRTIETHSADSERGRIEIVKGIRASLGAALRFTPDEIGTMSFGQQAQMRGSLPNAGASPLLGYQPPDLRNRSRVRECEMRHIAQYIEQRLRILQVMKPGTSILEFTEEPQNACSSLTEPGKSIKVVTPARQARALNVPPTPERYSFRRRLGEDTYYWFPQKSLP